MESARPVLVLDLDDTLIHASLKPDSEDSFPVKIFRRRFYINIRPGAIEALEKLSKVYELFIFTASRKEYAEPIIDRIAPFIPKENRLFNDSCETMSGYIVKDLTRLQRPLNNTLLIDDMMGSGLKQPKNVVGVSPWLGERDDELMTSTLLPMLLDVSGNLNLVDFVRREIKSGSRHGLAIF